MKTIYNLNTGFCIYLLSKESARKEFIMFVVMEIGISIICVYIYIYT